MKGKSEPVPAFRLVRLDAAAAGLAQQSRRPARRTSPRARAVARRLRRRDVDEHLPAVHADRPGRRREVTRRRRLPRGRSRTARRSREGARCPTARGSRTGRWSRRSFSLAFQPGGGDPLVHPPTHSSRHGRCWSGWPRNVPSCSSSTTCTGPSRRCSISSSTSATGRAAFPSSCCASRGPSYSTCGPGGRVGS